ncbi:MAG: hypothetical protein Q9187_003175 [Circinaria calcarea]
MENQGAVPQSQILVKADEVDEAGVDISTISTTDDGSLDAQIEARQKHNTTKPLANAVSSTRPILRREASAPPPPKQPPPPAPHQEEPNPTDSLSLAQLKRLVSDLPKLEAAAYAYKYEDTRTFPEELEEWFQYTEEDKHMLTKGKVAFTTKWSRYPASNGGKLWLKADPEERAKFVESLLQDLPQLDYPEQVKNLGALSYIVLGIWNDTAGLEDDSTESNSVNYQPPNDRYRKCSEQVRWIHDGAKILYEVGAEQKLYDILRTLLDSDKSVVLFPSFVQRVELIRYSRTNDMTNESSNLPTNHEATAGGPMKRLGLGYVMTIMYVMIESGRQQAFEGGEDSMRHAIVALEPNLLHFLSSLVAKLRWDDSSDIPLTRVILLLWKSILLVLGGTRQLTDGKCALRKECKGTDDQESSTYITASPLDYHLFRQEITSKYPAYNPPPPLVPIEPENSSVLPPLPSHPSRNGSQDNVQLTTIPGVNGNGRSIFHQPVHIATPAPSPPPSPAGPGGKGGKKQNYQTNQNFPFLYPPLDDSSNTIGGKGNAGLQDHLVGKRWEGSDIPASILEAGQLFASRMRMTRSLRQLWDVREKYMSFERGWENSETQSQGQELKLDILSLQHDETSDYETSSRPPRTESRLGETENEDLQQRLNAVEDYYVRHKTFEKHPLDTDLCFQRSSLPHLQSIVIVLLKIVLSNVTAFTAQPSLTGHGNGQNGIPNSFSLQDDHDTEPILRIPKNNLNLGKQLNGQGNGSRAETEYGPGQDIEEKNAIRLREITSKAIAGILLVLLRWFKLSHVLKFEYLTQLLLDSNYLPLALKFFAHQDFDRAVGNRNDIEDLGFFHTCQKNSKNPPPPPPSLFASSSSSSEDEAQPPPIPKHRQSPTSSSLPPSPRSSPSPPPLRPEVDELGYPTTAIPQEPLTTYAPRFFYTTITHLRLLQKITKRKAHRALLLVQYKSSTILRKALKIPQPDLRLYTLKLFKSQVPYCGRKWRQSNMRVITAIYLHCKPELRDEWLAGGDVDGVVEEAVPLEQAGRSLVHWWHLREYRDVMEGGGIMEKRDTEKDDFFARELERMGWDGGGLAETQEDGGGEGESASGGGTEWDGGPLQLEGW